VRASSHSNKDILRIAFDIDCTLTKKFSFDYINIPATEHYNFYMKCKPNKTMIELCNKYKKDGHEVFIFTSRATEHFYVTKRWLRKNKVKYHYLIMNKPYYDIIYDDKSKEVIFEEEKEGAVRKNAKTESSSKEEPNFNR